MKQPQGCIKNVSQGEYGLFPVFFDLQLLLCDLEVPIRKFAPDEFVNLTSGLAILEGLEEALHIADQRV